MREKIKNENIKEYLNKIKKMNFDFIDEISKKDMADNKEDFAILFMLSLSEIISSKKLNEKELKKKDNFIEKMLKDKNIVGELNKFGKSLIDISINEKQKNIMKNTKRKKVKKKLI